MTIVITGGSGFIGTRLTQKLLTLGDIVIVVDVVAPKFTHQSLYFIQCDITTTQLPFNVLEQTDAVINLVGKSIVCKWNEKTKEEIRNSRIISTNHIVMSMKGATNRPTILINASAVGVYGERGDEELDEGSHVGVGFLADLVRDWEGEAHKAEVFGTRVVCIRTGNVIGKGGMLSTLKRYSKFGFMFKFSKKDFWQPWIHEDDIVNTYLFALQTSTLQGNINAVSPEQLKHSELMKIVSKFLKRRVVGVMPTFLRKIMFGECLDEITRSQKVVPQRLLDKGFTFQFPEIKNAIRESLNK